MLNFTVMRVFPKRRWAFALGTAIATTACAARTPPPKDAEPAPTNTVEAANEPPIQDAGSDACVVGTQEPADDGCNTRICMPDHTWATTLAKCTTKLLALTLPDQTPPTVCRRTGAGGAISWALPSDEPYCLVVPDLVDPTLPTSIASAQDRAAACGGGSETIDLELAIGKDGTVTKSTVLRAGSSKTKLETCVAAAYRAIEIRTIPPRALTLRVRHPFNRR